MGKAEKFIEDYTNHCSNELCAVEDRFGKKVISYREWLTPEQARSAVEIEREEVIDKACRYLQDHIDKDLVIYHSYTWRKRDEFIKSLKKALEE